MFCVCMCCKFKRFWKNEARIYLVHLPLEVSIILLEVLFYIPFSLMHPCLLFISIYVHKLEDEGKKVK